MKLTKDHDKEHNILSVRWNDKCTKVCEEFKTSHGQEFVIDLSHDDKIIGIEIFDFERRKKPKWGRTYDWGDKSPPYKKGKKAIKRLRNRIIRKGVCGELFYPSENKPKSKYGRSYGWE